MKSFVAVAVSILALAISNGAVSISNGAVSKGDSSGQLVQAYGVICSTEWGTCEVAPQPIGSVCFCGGAQGFIAG